MADWQRWTAFPVSMAVGFAMTLATCNVWAQGEVQGEAPVEEAAAESVDAETHAKLRKAVQQQFKLSTGFDAQQLKSVGDELRQLASRTENVVIQVAARVDAFAVDRALARLLIRKNQLALNEQEKQLTLQQARSFLVRGQTLCAETIELLQHKVSSLEVDATQLEKWKKTLASAQLSHALMAEELADTYDVKDEKRGDSLRSAKSAYEDVYQRYRTALIGVYAQLYQGRVHWKLRELEEAVDILESLLRLPNQPAAFETVKLKASLVLSDCRLQEKEPDRAAEASRLRKQLQGVSRKLATTQDVRLLRERLKDLERNLHGDPAIPEGGAPTAVEVSAVRDDEERTPAEEKKIAEYRLAYAKVRETLARYQTAQATVAHLKLEQDSPADSDEDRKPLEEQRGAAEVAARKSLMEAITACGKMLELGNAKASQRPTSVPLYYLSYLHMLTQDYATALLYAEDLARNQPLAAHAPQAAKIAAACYLQRVNLTADPAEKNNLLRQFFAIQVHTIKTWPTSKEAQEAEATLRKVKAAQDAARAKPQQVPPQ